MSWRVMLCEKCGLVHRTDYDGIYCRDEECQGRLIPVIIAFSSDNNEEPPTEEQEPIAS